MNKKIAGLGVVMAAVAAMSLAPQAEAAPPSARNFSYTASPTFTQGAGNGSGPGAYGPVDAHTTANVQPYFYATGAIGGTFDVTGYGAGVSSGVSQFDVYHNQSYTTTNTGYGDLQGPGGQVIEHQMREVAYRHDGTVIYDSGTVPAGNFNGTGGPTTPTQTQGHIQDTYTHTITVGPEDSPGTYADTAQTTFNVF
jgi:hypothetical protein